MSSRRISELQTSILEAEQRIKSMRANLPSLNSSTSSNTVQHGLELPAFSRLSAVSQPSQPFAFPKFSSSKPPSSQSNSVPSIEVKLAPDSPSSDISYFSSPPQSRPPSPELKEPIPITQSPQELEGYTSSSQSPDFDLLPVSTLKQAFLMAVDKISHLNQEVEKKNKVIQQLEIRNKALLQLSSSKSSQTTELAKILGDKCSNVDFTDLCSNQFGKVSRNFGLLYTEFNNILNSFIDFESNAVAYSGHLFHALDTLSVEHKKVFDSLIKAEESLDRVTIEAQKETSSLSSSLSLLCNSYESNTTTIESSNQKETSTPMAVNQSKKIVSQSKPSPIVKDTSVISLQIAQFRQSVSTINLNDFSDFLKSFPSKVEDSDLNDSVVLNLCELLHEIIKCPSIQSSDLFSLIFDLIKALFPKSTPPTAQALISVLPQLLSTPSPESLTESILSWLRSIDFGGQKMI
ncbi:hypothetical protein GEMRC1_004488 [Eukaryota sp. GEM-RC1]